MKKKKTRMFMMITALAMVALTACDQAPPRIGNISVSGTLVKGVETSITVSCTVLGAENVDIASVKADLSAIGGSDNTTLVKFDGDNWQWYGAVTPPEADNMTIVITAKDSRGQQGSADATVTVTDPADYPPDNSIVRFIEPSDIILDTTTGLMWQKTPAGTYYTWQQAVDYCNNLELNRYADWRLPSKDELNGLISGWSGGSPAEWLNSQGFPNWKRSIYWSSTAYAYNTYNVWSVDFYSGDVYNDNKASTSYVRAVRGGP